VNFCYCFVACSFRYLVDKIHQNGTQIDKVDAKLNGCSLFYHVYNLTQLDGRLFAQLLSLLIQVYDWVISVKKKIDCYLWNV
jgi:hypothetical protein